MRSYQRKKVIRLAKMYRSPDPLRWVYLSSMMGVDRPLTDRERRIFVRRFAHGMKQIGRTINLALAAAVSTATKAINGLLAYFYEIQQNPDKFDLKLTMPPLTLPDMPVEGIGMHHLTTPYDLKLQQPNIPPITGVTSTD